MWSVIYRNWVQVWPNLEASAIWTVPVLWWHHLRIRAHVAKAIREVSGRDGSA